MTFALSMKNTPLVLFAGDTNLLSICLDATCIRDGVNPDLALITEYKADKLSLNIKKTHHICFSAKKSNKIKSDISFKIYGEIIPEVPSLQFLCAFNDDEWNWRVHVSFYAEKLLVAELL